MKNMTNREIIESYIPVAQFIAAACGPRYEVTLHDLSDIEHSVVFIANDLTGRKVGDGLLDFALEIVLDRQNIHKPFVANLYGRSMGKNKRLRFSDYYIRNNAKEIIGLLCITTDMSGLDRMQRFLDAEFVMDPPDIRERQMQRTGQEFVISAADLIGDTLGRVMAETGRSDPEELKKEEKMLVISALNDMNLFAMKGAIALTARKLHISEPTAYRYLQQIRNET